MDFDLGALYAALDAQRLVRGLSWQQAAREISGQLSRVPARPIMTLRRIGAVAQPSQPPPPASPSFVNRAWRVSASSAVATGTLYVFLSDGTLVIASPHSEPLVGSWQASDGGLTMVEESIPYKVEILKLDAHSFAIRSHNPGALVDISLVPADSRK